MKPAVRIAETRMAEDAPRLDADRHVCLVAPGANTSQFVDVEVA